MKKTFVFLLSLLVAVSCYDDTALRKQMQEFEDRLTDLAGSVIAPIDKQIEGITASIDSLKDVDAELREYIKELETLVSDKDVSEPDLTALKDAIAELKKEDTALDGKIADLQSYVDGSLLSSKDWTESTFATLDHYESAQKAIESVKLTLGHLEEDVAALETSFGQQLADAISATESGMKTWVNEHLAQSYYDITSVDAKLADLEATYKDADASLKENIEAQQKALEQARTELTKEYQKAIREAIEENDGVLDSKIADAVKTAQEALQEQIDAIGEVVEALEVRLSLLETDFVNRIQSLVYVPEYTDGKVSMYQGDGSFNVKFLVTPTRLAADLRTLWQTDRNVISAALYYAADPQTKSGDNALPLDVTSVEATSEGLLYLTVSEDPENPVKEEFWEGEIGAFACIRITDGNNDKASELIALEGKKGNAFPDHTELPIPGPGTPSGVSRTANCYIISDAGSYTLKTVKGNSAKSVGIVAAAEVLWESFGTDETPEVGGLIASVSYFNGRIGFTTAETFREGNAVIAAKDSEGNVLWSWHIWMTDEPEEQVYYNGAGTMMDRNLGATSATPGDVGALGLMYQWGRKDPFLGSSSVSESVVAASTLSWPVPVASDASTGTIEYATANPTTFITGNDANPDWLQYPDKTLWQSFKTMYDPCPVGWQVPDCDVWGESRDYDSSYDSSNFGFNLSGSLGDYAYIWYSLTGFYGYGTGGLFQSGAMSRFWSATTSDDGVYWLAFHHTLARKVVTNNCALGGTVRCMKVGSRSSVPDTPDPTPDQEPESQAGDYVDEYGINHGQGIQIGATVWAPVNCGYHATDHKWGKLYQWGRKYGQGCSGDSSETIPVAGPVSLSVGQSVDNADKFYYSSTAPCDWLDTADPALWNSGTEDEPVKTVYDPCPAGWRVPTTSEFETLCVNRSDWTTDDTGQNGYWFSGEVAYSENVARIFFPAASGGGYYDGVFTAPGTWGSYWCSEPGRNDLACYLRTEESCIYVGRRANGYSVRCVLE